MTLSLHDWVTITATSGMPLYAVLSNVSDAQAVKNYYITDGSQTPYGLYSQTPYSNWISQKITQLARQFNQHSADSHLTQILVSHLQQELQLASNPFDTMF